MLKVRVPATSANLGSGFDALGVAIELYNEISIEEWDSCSITSMDGIEVPTDESNLIYENAKALFQECGKPVKGFKIEQWNNIPLARGLGSSSACVVAGLAGANGLLGNPLNRDELLNLATKIEGHPDNVAPAIFGGLTCSVMDNGKVCYIHEPLKQDIQFVVIIPDTELKTSVARAALPKTVSHEDARYNLSRSALMAMSLKEGWYNNLKFGAQDRLHQPYRFPFIQNGQEVVDFCYKAGAYAAMISGAGSTLMSIVDASDHDYTKEIKEYLDNLGLSRWKVASYLVDNHGVIVI